MNNFKPQLLPNNKVGEPADWEDRIKHPTDWLYSNKLDGARIELFASNGTVKGRSLKDIPSAHIQQMGKDIIESIPFMSENCIIECEFYSPEMNFAEIMHFFRCADVTSEKEVKKYQKLWDKSGGDPTLGWTFPGRTVEWLTTWHKSLKFYAFDVVNVNSPKETKHERMFNLENYVKQHVNGYVSLELDLKMIAQHSFDHIDNLYQAYDQAIISGYEGLVVMHKYSTYKFGRHTLNSKQAFKIKNDDVEFDGQILAVEESTVAREGSERTVNELGRSKTSQLKEDRVPSGMAKGFLVKMDDGNTLTVPLKNYNHDERRDLLENANEWVGLWIKFTGMHPVKEGGCPRHAHYTKGNVRDEK